MKIHFAYYNQFKNGIDIAFADNTLLFLSCVEAEKELHTTPNSQRLIDNLAIEDPLSYVAMAYLTQGIPSDVTWSRLIPEPRYISVAISFNLTIGICVSTDNIVSR